MGHDVPDSWSSEPWPLSRRAILGGSAAAGLAGAAGATWAPATASPTAGGNASAFVLPGLKRWHGEPGALVLDRRVDVVLPRNYPRRLEAVAHRLCRDLVARGRRSHVRRGRPREGDVALHLHRQAGPKDDRGPRSREAYRLVVARHVQIHARSATGAYWATRTLLQWHDRNQGRLPHGHGRDWPDFPERALMVDIGRKHFSLPWLRARIREMSDMKMNLLHLHFTEDLGWRFESTASPQVHSDRFISQRDVRSLVEYAAGRHVAVMPEIDLPGHFLEGLRNYPSLQLTDALGRPNPGKLDYTLPAAKKFVLDRFREYLPLFPDRDWHLGGDEFLNPVEAATYPQLGAYARSRAGLTASNQDGAVAFLNDLNDFLRARGKRCRMWNDGLAGIRNVEIARNVSIDWWADISPLGDATDPVLPGDLVAQGYRVNNCSWYPTYLAYRLAKSPTPGLQPFYEDWTPARFRGPGYASDEIAPPYYEVAPHAVSGAKMHVWLDEPQGVTGKQVAGDLAPRLAIMAERTWNQRSRLASYDAFARASK
jgi:hexosaminidase